MRLRRGQSTTEFALMIPLIFALLFAVIEYAYYLGALHHINWATFSAARAQQVGDNARLAAKDLLTGNMTSGVQISAGGDSVTSRFRWTAQTPGFKQVMGNMDAQMGVTLGPEECEYESQAAITRTGASVNAFRYADNKLTCN